MSGWRSLSLGELCAVTAGGTPSRSRREYFGGNIPWVKIGDMLQGEILQTEESITGLGLANSAAKILPAGTVLISIFATIGRTAVLGIEASTNQAIAGIMPRDSTILSTSYLRRYLDSVVEHLQRRARGVAQVNINAKILKSLQVPLPPMTEQRRITSILDRADSLRSSRRLAIKLLDDLRRSIFLEMFGEPKNSWLLHTVAEIAAHANGSIRTGPFGSQLLHSEFTDSGIAVLGIDNAVNNVFQWARRRYIGEEKYVKLARYTVHPGDVLITIMGTCGRCAVVPDDIPVAINTKHLCCITLDRAKCVPEFLHSYFLWHPVARSYLTRTAKGAIMSGLNMTIIKDLPVALPPVELQREYVSNAASVQALGQKNMLHLNALDELFGSLQADAFANEL